jgi:hypothetical protein
MRCKYIKENGERCKANAMENGYCYLHNPDIPEEEKQLARVKGGENNIVLVGELLDVTPVRTSEDVVSLMESVINRVKEGRLDIRVANTIGYLAGVSQKAIKDVEVEGRLKRIEESLKS